ncbi:PAN domain-containing protein [Vibrio campbellii]|uniref:PAN domain-containing protein n=1 Tax=Vibrio campbellii TaxID=680 RepID=UPI00249C412A|nr:PAN domain-containing protein [Vibrio campbellii]
MKQTIKSIPTAVWLTGWAILLSGCGGGDDSSPSKPTVPASPLVAFDGLMTAKVDTPTVMDLTPYIQGQAPRLTAVGALEPENCYVSASGDLGVEVTLTRPGRCDYTYTVVDQSGTSSSADLTVVSSDAERPVLPAGSIATTPSANVVVELDELLGANVIPNGYALSDLKVQHEQGSESVSDLKQTGPLTFSFTSPDVFGWNYISYVVTNATTGNAMVGSVFVSIADELNEPPVISEPLFTYPKSVTTNELVTIDLLAVSGLTITDDSGQWQLQNVKALGATVTPVAPDNSTNKAFTFRASSVGTYDVAYIVSDYVGGATMGIIRFNVDSVPITPTKPWKDISTGGLVYTAPLIHTEATAHGNAQYSIETIKGNNYQVARWGNTPANQFCEDIGGRLPTLAELQSLHGATGAAATERSNWPVNIPYLSHDAQYGLVSLKDGSYSSYLAGYEAYVTCIDRGISNLKLEPLYTNDGENTTADSLIAGKTMNIKATLTTKNGGLPLEGIALAATLESKTAPQSVYFDVTASKTLSLTAKETKSLTLVGCATQCLDTTSYDCEAIAYDTTAGSCRLYDETPKPADFTDAESQHSVYVRNKVLRGVETMTCPNETDEDGIAQCQYSNTIAGKSTVQVEAQQSLGIDNANASSVVTITPDHASVQINAPAAAYLLPGDEPTTVNVSKTDKYGNLIPGIYANITDMPDGDIWTLDGQSGGKPEVSYPTSDERALQVAVDCSNNVCSSRHASLNAIDIINNAVTSITRLYGSVPVYPCPGENPFACIPRLPVEYEGIDYFYTSALSKTALADYPEAESELLRIAGYFYTDSNQSSGTNETFLAIKYGNANGAGPSRFREYCRILGDMLGGAGFPAFTGPSGNANIPDFDEARAYLAALKEVSPQASSSPSNWDTYAKKTRLTYISRNVITGRWDWGNENEQYQPVGFPGWGKFNTDSDELQPTTWDTTQHDIWLTVSCRIHPHSGGI